jgi:uncharacterized protein YjbI with pentapeptide repeats
MPGAVPQHLGRRADLFPLQAQIGLALRSAITGSHARQQPLVTRRSRGADLRQAKLDGANLGNPNLTGAQVMTARARNLVLRASLAGANFFMTVLTGPPPWSARFDRHLL